jgi:hypothetical protein
MDTPLLYPPGTNRTASATAERVCRQNPFSSALLIVLVLLSMASLHAQPSGPPPAASETQVTSLPDSADEVQWATIGLDGNIITKIRGVSSFPASQRAAEINARIHALAEDTAIDTSSIRLVQGGEDWTGINAGSTLLLRIYDLDAIGHGISRHSLAETVRLRLTRVIGSYREARAPGALLRQTFYALGATLLLALGLSNAWTQQFRNG